jgi:4-hydroxy-tetrahydrodipicolinate reductase
MINLGILGAKGRMGQLIVGIITSEFNSSAQVKTQANRGDDFAPLLDCDVVIDVSSPTAMCELAKLGIEKKQKLPVFIVGSTGWKAEEQTWLEKLSLHTAVLVASNFSVGVFVLNEMLRTFAPLLGKLGYTPVLVETHHRHKKDAPSGTAISLQKKISPLSPSKVQTHSIRAGEAIGDHEVTFYGAGDRLVLSHFAHDRSIFARGAIQAALWLTRQQSEHTYQKGVIGIEHFFENLKKECIHE